MWLNQSQRSKINSVITIDPQEPLKAILPFVKNWLQLLADGKLAEACAQLDEPAYDDVRWTPESILQAAHDTFSPQSRFYKWHPEGPIFTSPYDLDEQTDLIEDWLENAAEDDEPNDDFIYFDYYVPLNGECSEMPALFEFYKRDGGYVVMLRDLHVL